MQKLKRVPWVFSGECIGCILFEVDGSSAGRISPCGRNVYLDPDSRPCGEGDVIMIEDTPEGYANYTATLARKKLGIEV